MDFTGVPGYTQVTQEVVDALQGSHFEFKCRGQIKVKGKGEMVTYFLCDTKPPNDMGVEMGLMRQPNFHENANFQGSAINKEIYMKKKNFGNYLEEKPSSSSYNGNLYNGMNLTENLNYVKREYDNYNKININNHYNINNYNMQGHQHQYSTQPQPIQQYNIRENFNIIENPSEKQPRNNYLDEPSNFNNHYNIMHVRNEHEQEPLLTNANVMPKVLYRNEQTNKYEPPQYIGVPFQRTIQPMTHEGRYRQHQQLMKKQTNSVPLRYHTSGASNVNEIYMKPLPKLPNEFNESREMSSTDDLSQSDHRQSVSVDSSSDESYSKTTDDCDQSNLKLNIQKGEQKHLIYQQRFGVMSDEHKAITNLKDLHDYEISSTTDHTVSTIPNKGESCNSFEFHDKRKIFSWLVMRL